MLSRFCRDSKSSSINMSLAGRRRHSEPVPQARTGNSTGASFIEASEAGWLRFTWIEWQDRMIAAHFGFHWQHTWYKPSFTIDLAQRSPGEVLLRRLLLAAIREGADAFDFGLGDER